MNPSKNSLAYDLQEPFRFLVDLAVISLIDSGKMDNKDFICIKIMLWTGCLKTKLDSTIEIKFSIIWQIRTQISE